MKVLLVDDSAAVRASFAELLATVAGVEVVGSAEDVAGARAMIEARSPELVVLDVELRQGERGIEVLDWVRRAHPAVDVVVLSNFSWQAMRSRLLTAGAAAYFDKAGQFALARDWIAARAAAAAPGAAPARRA